MKKIFGLLLCCLYVLPVAGQQTEVLKATNTSALQSLIQQRQTEIRLSKQKALLLARKINYPIFHESADGNIIQLKQLSPTGRLQYYTTFNTNSAKTISADKIWPGGNIGYNLSGAGFTLGEWDGGAVLAAHTEFNGRVIQGDSAATVSQHATHVAGTLVASGINARAKGMAYQARLKAYDWEDDEIEMAREAASGMLVSNHSYGYIGGWNYNNSKTRWEWWGDVAIDSLTDYSFGYYDQQARNWDQISYNAPYYLMLKAAGNDRGQAGPANGTEHYVFIDTGWVASTANRNADGPYDCMTGAANAKNVLTMGAISAITAGYTGPASVKMSNFSSWGPTDDGRIKPDLVANGVSVYSTTNGINSYGTSSGTSMATPSAAGSLLLLQQHYTNRKKGRLMRSATLKALTVHTADEAGAAPGPDYAYGWGLLNVSRAAELITQDSISAVIQELTITQGEVINIFVNADPDQVLSATISWTDPAAMPGAPALNARRKLLVNDLDLRIINTANFAQHQPWKLDVENPDQPATRGDNDVDNIEKVQVSSPGSGTYIIRIAHKGLLTNLQQNFSLVVSGIKMSNALSACHDTIVFNANSGKFDDGSGNDNYADNADCFWKIKLPSPGAIALKIDSMALAVNDVIRIYDGEDVNAALIKTIKGSDSVSDSVYSSGNAMLVRFSSDGQGNDKGWLAAYNACTQPYNNFTTNTTTTANMYEFKNYSYNADSYVWYYGNGDSAVTTAATHSYTYTTPGSYTVTLVAKNKCASHTVSKELGSNTVVVTGTPEVVQKEFKLYPNPSKGEFMLEMHHIKPQKASLQIYNLKGQVVYSEDFQVQGSTYQHPVIVREGKLPGMYILQLTLEQEVITKKIIID